MQTVSFDPVRRLRSTETRGQMQVIAILSESRQETVLWTYFVDELHFDDFDFIMMDGMTQAQAVEYCRRKDVEYLQS